MQGQGVTRGSGLHGGMNTSSHGIVLHYSTLCCPALPGGVSCLGSTSVCASTGPRGHRCGRHGRAHQRSGVTGGFTEVSARDGLVAAGSTTGDSTVNVVGLNHIPADIAGDLIDYGVRVPLLANELRPHSAQFSRKSRI